MGRCPRTARSVTPAWAGARFWVDPVNEIVGVYLGVCTEADSQTGEQKTEFDLFQNLVTAAVAD